MNNLIIYDGYELLAIKHYPRISISLDFLIFLNFEDSHFLKKVGLKHRRKRSLDKQGGCGDPNGR